MAVPMAAPTRLAVFSISRRRRSACFVSVWKLPVRSKRSMSTEPNAISAHLAAQDRFHGAQALFALADLEEHPVAIRDAHRRLERPLRDVYLRAAQVCGNEPKASILKPRHDRSLF